VEQDRQEFAEFYAAVVARPGYRNHRPATRHATGTVASHLHRGLTALRRQFPSLDDQERIT